MNSEMKCDTRNVKIPLDIKIYYLTQLSQE